MNLQTSNSETYTVAFYNTENLFDFIDDPLINDIDFLEASNKNWNKNDIRIKSIKRGWPFQKLGLMSFKNHQH